MKLDRMCALLSVASSVPLKEGAAVVARAFTEFTNSVLYSRELISKIGTTHNMEFTGYYWLCVSVNSEHATCVAAPRDSSASSAHDATMLRRLTLRECLLSRPMPKSLKMGLGLCLASGLGVAACCSSGARMRLPLGMPKYLPCAIPPRSKQAQDPHFRPLPGKPAAGGWQRALVPVCLYRER